MDGDQMEAHNTAIDAINSSVRASTDYKQVMQPFRKILLLFGLMYDNNARFARCSKVYHFSVSTIMWLYFLRGFSMYRIGELFGIELIGKLFIHALSFLAASSLLVGTLLSRSHHVMIDKYSSYMAKYTIVTDQVTTRRRKKTMWIGISLCIVTVFMEMVIINIAGLWRPAIRYFCMFYTMPFIEPCDTSHFNAIFSAVLISGLSAIPLILTITNVYLIIVTISDDFGIYNKQFAFFIENKIQLEPSIATHIETWRCRHADLCAYLEYVDQSFGPYILLLFIGLIPMTASLLFATITCIGLFHDTDFFIDTMFLMAFALFYNIGALSLIIHLGSTLNQQVRISNINSATLC